MSDFSKNLKKLRKDNNLSQEQLADILGVSRQAISKWESDVAYPEMDKIIQICKKFDVNIDDLLNKDINEVKSEEESKNNISKYISDFLSFITDSIGMFSNMSFGTKVKCIYEQLILLCIFYIMFMFIGAIGRSLIFEIFYNFMPYKFYAGLSSIIKAIYVIFFILISATILIHIFKIRYLNYYRNIKASVDDENSKDVDKHNKILFENNENKIVIRDPKNMEYTFLNPILKLLILFIKTFALIVTLLLSFGLILLVILLVISFLIIKTGIFFVGLLIGLFSLGVIVLVLILLLFNFIFNRKSDKKKIIWSFILSIIGCGISLGLLFIGSLSFNITSELDDDLYKTESIQLNMADDLTIVNYDNIEYIEKDIDNVIIEYSICKGYSFRYDLTDSNRLYLYSYDSNIFETIRFIIKELNNKKVISINGELQNVKVYATKANIEKLKINK